MSSATSVATPSAYTEQPPPRVESRSQHAVIPVELWGILILSAILWALLAWRVIEEAGDRPTNSDNSENWFPPL